ncbi:MAG: hypothetical protein KC657_16625 [Myxococcales bacterium]|nr:hypothetical protein [Myxococcales bacterium]
MYRSPGRAVAATPTQLVWYDATKAFLRALTVFVATFGVVSVGGGSLDPALAATAPLVGIVACFGAFAFTRTSTRVELTVDASHRHLRVVTAGEHAATVLRLAAPVHAAVEVTPSGTTRSPDHHRLLLRDACGSNVALLASGYDARLFDVASDLNRALREYGTLV